MLVFFILHLLFLSLMTKAEEVSAQESNQSVKTSSIDNDAASTAEFRQGGGIGQQLMSVPASSIYGGNSYGQYMANSAAAATAAGAGAGYGNMIRQLYRPSSFGLTDKVRNWVKSFLNRRQYVKPYYNPALLSYGGGATGLEEKPVYINGVSYKPISVPLRQLQKYFKPFYGGNSAQAAADSGLAQYLAAAAASPPRSPSSAASFGGDSGLYASESAGTALFSSGIPGVGIFSGSPNSGSSAFGSSSNFGGFSSGSSSGQLGSLGSSLSFAPSSGGLFTSSGGMYNPSAGFGAGGLSSSGGNMYNFGSSGGLGASMEDLASSSSSFYPSSGNNNNNNNNAVSSSISGIYGGLRNVDSGSSYSVGGSSDSAQNYASYSVGGSPSEAGYSSYEPGNYPVESAYSMSYQRAPQSAVASGKSYSASSFQEKSSQFQPVSFAASDGGSSFKAISNSGNANSGHHAVPSLSSSSSALYISEKSS